MNLAHSSNEKITCLENQNAQTIIEIDNLQKQLVTVRNDYENLESKNKQLNEIVAHKELAIKEVSYINDEL